MTLTVLLDEYRQIDEYKTNTWLGLNTHDDRSRYGHYILYLIIYTFTQLILLINKVVTTSPPLLILMDVHIWRTVLTLRVTLCWFFLPRSLYLDFVRPGLWSRSVRLNQIVVIVDYFRFSHSLGWRCRNMSLT